MKKLIVCLLMGLFLGCTTYTTIQQVENKWGPPARVEQRGDTTIYYYHWRRNFKWYTVEITTDKEGKIVSKRKYRPQPKFEPPPAARNRTTQGGTAQGIVMAEPLDPKKVVSMEELTISNMHVLYWSVSRGKRKFV